MPSVRQFITSSVGRKILAAATGLGLAAFVVAHLVGNFTLLMGADVFNSYAYFLEHLAHGWFIIIAEIGLIAFFLLHAHSGVKVYLQKRAARKQGYEMVGDAGGRSRKSLASRSMIVTGPILLIFVVLHVLHFKFGPGLEENYVAIVKGKEMRDLYLLVIQEFNKLPIMLGYVVVMVLLGFHLHHGLWSAFQSLGWTSRKYLPLVTTAGVVVAVLLAVGFIYIPIHVYLFIDPAAPTTVQVTGGGLS